MEQQGFYKTALYCRLSLDDGQTGDSSSIQTQKAMLERYAKEQGFTIHDFYVDDGYTGLNFNRPSFQRLLRDIEDGKINLVITKDLSRLGRDYIMTGHYMEIYFPEKNVRYIALNDNIDTIRDDNDFAPFRSILNDLYAKDISKKVKTAKRQRAMQGLYIGNQPAYGYKKDPNNKNKLLIDEEVADVVRMIFDLALTGNGGTKIAKILNFKRIIVPSVYKSLSGYTSFNHYVKNFDEEEKYAWEKTTISGILKNQIYCGDMVQSKMQTVNYKTKKQIKNPPEKRIVVKNTHEAIVSEEIFMRVQELMKAHHNVSRYNLENLFRGLVYCKICNEKMSLTHDIRVDRKTRIIYKCKTCSTKRNYEPKHFTIFKYDELKTIATERLRGYIDSVKTDPDFLKFIREKLKTKISHVNYDLEIAKINKRLTQIIRLNKKLYEDYAEEIITRETYHDLAQEYETEQKLLKDKADYFLKQSLTDNSQLDNLNEVNQNLIYKLIDKIEISSEGEYRKPHTKTVNIIYRFAKPN